MTIIIISRDDDGSIIRDVVLLPVDYDIDVRSRCHLSINIDYDIDAQMT